MRSLTALVVVAAMLVGCSSEDPGADVGEGAGAASEAREYSFTYSNPDRPYTAAQVRILQQALQKIANVAKRGDSPVRRWLATETLARIEAGDVLLGGVQSARGIDRFHMCKDLKLSGCEGPAPADDDRTWMGDAALSRKLGTELLGYQWGNRIYFTINQDSDIDLLAATLVHEVNHVLNRSECSYYKNLAEHEMDGNKAFVEEYRAYVSECWYKKDASANADTCTTYATDSLEQYAFVHDLTKIVPRGKPAENKTITELVAATADGGEPVLGRLIPESRYWPSSFGACPTTRR